MKKLLDAHTEIQVVAKMVRGDTYKEIAEWLQTSKDISISATTLTKVKERNNEAFAVMASKIAEVETSKATDLLYKAHQALENKLDNHLNVAKALADVEQRYQDGEFDDPDNQERGLREYYFQKELVFKQSNLSVSELTSLSKEMFTESQVLAGKPTSITDNPARASDNVKRLLLAMKEGDESKMLDAIFPND